MFIQQQPKHRQDWNIKPETKHKKRMFTLQLVDNDAKPMGLMMIQYNYWLWECGSGKSAQSADC